MWDILKVQPRAQTRACEPTWTPETWGPLLPGAVPQGLSHVFHIQIDTPKEWRLVRKESCCQVKPLQVSCPGSQRGFLIASCPELYTYCVQPETLSTRLLPAKEQRSWEEKEPKRTHSLYHSSCKVSTHKTGPRQNWGAWGLTPSACHSLGHPAVVPSRHKRAATHLTTVS